MLTFVDDPGSRDAVWGEVSLWRERFGRRWPGVPQAVVPHVGDEADSRFHLHCALPARFEAVALDDAWRRGVVIARDDDRGEVVGMASTADYLARRACVMGAAYGGITWSPGRGHKPPIIVHEGLSLPAAKALAAEVFGCQPRAVWSSDDATGWVGPPTRKLMFGPAHGDRVRMTLDAAAVS